MWCFNDLIETARMCHISREKLRFHVKFSWILWKYFVKWDHSAEIRTTQCGNNGYLLSHFFDKNFVKAILYYCRTYKELVSRKKIDAQCGKTRNSLSPNFFFVKSTTYLTSSFVKTLLSRIFCQKSVRDNFLFFHTVLWHCSKILVFSFEKNSVKSCTELHRWWIGFTKIFYVFTYISSDFRELFI